MNKTPDTTLLIFSKYPLAGKAKTRLIPALGADVAAQLHRRMTEATIDTVQSWQQKVEEKNIQITVHYTGAVEKDFHSWLGSSFDYQKQPAGDLGQRMCSAFETAFNREANHAIGIGTDVPALTPALLQQAENLLSDHDLVLGPAADGGYYLIGLKTSQPELFANIDWGTEHVLQQTREIATRLGLQVATLPLLSDIDRPEDLHSIKKNPRFSDIISSTPLLSVIIPTLNESSTLDKTLKNLQQADNVEIIIADGGSRDSTDTIATRSGAKLIEVSGGRSAQLNRGAAESRGRYLLFLHADTLLPHNYDKLICQALDNPSIVAGAFRFKTDAPGMAMRIIEWGTNLRSTLRQQPYGDQGLFMERRVFTEMGGFPALPIMEDFALVRQLRQRGTIITLAEEATTSARRWQKLGVIRTIVINQLMIAGFLLRVSPEKLSRFYRGKKKG